MKSYTNEVSRPQARWTSSHSVVPYFVLTFALSWTGALLVVMPWLVRREVVPKFTGLMIFPVMLLGPCIAGATLTWISGGGTGLRSLWSRMRKFAVAPKWYAPLFIPPILIAGVLLFLRLFVSQTFASNFFLAGVGFGAIAGFIEEIGWTGYAFPALVKGRNAFAAATFLGLIWGAWHIPVVDYLGTATPHGSFWLPYFLAFTATMVAMRVLICWLYVNTKSVLLAQLMHASSTGALVVLSPPRASAAQETLWYAVYALSLWIVVGTVVARCGRDLQR
jgi:membrane protease YdiL (CAAX protease family)